MYYGYIRVSTGTQVEKGFGLDTQKDGILAYAAEHNIKLENIFVDAGVSGNMKETDDDDVITKRTGLMELLSSVNKEDSVIVLNVSRLWRSDMTKVIVRRELMKKSINVISIQQPDYDMYKSSKDPRDYLLNTLTEMLDVYDRMTIALKLATGRTTKAHKGDKPAGNCPFGYRYTADKKHIEPDPEEAATLRQIFTEAQKGLSLDRIADELNRKGYKTRRGNEWQKGSLHIILKNNFYTGIVTHQGKEIPGNHEPLISKVQFGKVQAQLKRRKKG